MSKIKLVGDFNYSKKAILNEVVLLIKGRLYNIENDILKLRNSIEELEERYKLSTQNFLIDFNDGKLGDNKDFFSWEAEYYVLQDFIREKKLLEELI